MRKLLAIPIIALVVIASAQDSLRTTVTLAWNYGTNAPSTNWVIEIRSSATLSIAPTNWPIARVVSGTNTSATLPIAGQQTYYVVASSNWWGRVFSSVVGTAPLPPDGQLLIGP